MAVDHIQHSGRVSDPARPSSPETARVKLDVRDLGRMAYAEALDLQRRLQREVIESREKSDPPRRMYLLLLEHDPPVITVSRRGTAQQHLIATPEQLKKAGVEVAETDRGGDITYHGPGQLVAYPILDLNVLGLRLHSYMRFLEDVVIETLATFGIEAHRDHQATGVWVETSKSRKVEKSKTAMRGAGARGSAKICAMGVRISRWVSMHGLALNVATNLDHFNLIVPCGLPGRELTSMQRQLGDDCPSMEQVKRAFVERLERSLAERA